MTASYNLYHAGPFFSDPQIEVLKSVETALTNHGLTFFSPRVDCIELPLPESTWQERNATYKSCISGIEDSLAVLACLDYLDTDGNQSAEPDSGTVWEISHAYCPVFAYTLKGRKSLNLMVSQSVVGVFTSLEQIAAFAKKFKVFLDMRSDNKEEKVAAYSDLIEYAEALRWTGPVI